MVHRLAVLLPAAAALLAPQAPNAARHHGLNAATAAVVEKPVGVNMPGKEHMIDEELITNDAEAAECGDRCIKQAMRIFYDSPSEDGWNKELEEDGIFVESKPICGGYEASGVLLVRGLGIIDGVNSEEFFKFESSREGFQAIDEYLVNHRLVQRYNWDATRPGLVSDDGEGNAGDYSLMMNRVEWAYPGKSREFVALDVVDQEKKLLISTSSLHLDRPGSSRYNGLEGKREPLMPMDESEFVRAVQYYAAIVEDIAPKDDGTPRTLLRLATWGEMCDDYSAYWVNKFNAHVFITPKFKRFRGVVAKYLNKLANGEARPGMVVDGYEWEESNIADNAWLIPKLLGISPDKGKAASQSEFVKNLGLFDMNKPVPESQKINLADKKNFKDHVDITPAEGGEV